MSNNYCAVNAKLKAMYSTCLTGEDYRNMLSRTTVSDICSYLKGNTGYGDILSEFGEKDAHRGRVEEVLENNLYEQYIRLYSFMSRSGRSVLKTWLMHREIDYIKSRARGFFNGEVREDSITSVKNEFFLQHTRIDCEKAEAAASLSEFIEACRGSVFYDILKTAESIEADHFSIGMMLDSLYYTQLWKSREKLPEAERPCFEKLVGSIADMLNISWIYRGKKYFDFPSEIIYTYLIPVNYRLKGDMIKALVSVSSAEGMETLLRKTIYGELFSNLDEKFIEENFMRMETELSKKIFVNYPKSMAAVFAYLQLKQTEIYKITVIMEGVRYGLDAKIIESHLEGLA